MDKVCVGGRCLVLASPYAPRAVPQSVEVREQAEREDAHRVLGQATIAELGESPLTLDPEKRMLDHRAHPRPGAVDRIPVVRPLPTIVDQVPATAELPLNLASDLSYALSPSIVVPCRAASAAVA